jgi:hypothetical protein
MLLIPYGDESSFIRRVWRYQRDNQKPKTVGQIIQWNHENGHGKITIYTKHYTEN